MPDTKPKFDPSKPYKVEDKPAFDPTKPYSTSTAKNPYYDVVEAQQDLGKTNQIIESIPDLEGATQSKKDMLKDLAKRGASKDVLSNSILTLQGKHPKQQGGFKYYVDENGIPIPLANDERPPKGYDVASVWGSQKDASDDSMLTSGLKHVWNGVVGAADGVISLGETAAGLASGEPSKIAQTLKNSAQYLKFETPDYEKGAIFDTKGMKSWKDVFDPNRYDLSAGKVQGQLLQGLESVVSFAVGAKGLGNTAKYGKALYTASAYNLALSEGIDIAKDAGLEGRDVYGFASAYAVPQALLESAFGVGGLMVDNSVRAEVGNIGRIAASNLVKGADGKLTKESLEQLSKEMTIASAAVGKKYAGIVASTIGEEAATEGAQSIAEESSKVLYDKLKGDNKFNVDVFSPESLGKHINATISGALGSIGPSMAMSGKAAKISKQKEQSETAFGISQQGIDAVNNFNKQVDAAMENGSVSQEDGDRAKFKVNSFYEYQQQVKDKNLSDDNKKKAFDLSFQIQSLKSGIPTEKSQIDKLSPIEKADIHSKEEIAKGLQHELNGILLSGDVSKEPVVADKTMEKVEKEKSRLKDLISKHGDLSDVGEKEVLGSKEAESLKNELDGLKIKGEEDFAARKETLIGEGKTEKEATQIAEQRWRETEAGKRATEIEKILEKPVKPGRRRIEEVDTKEWNDKNKTTSLQKKQILQEHLKKIPGNQIDAHLQEGENGVISAILEDGKRVDLAQSAKSVSGKSSDFIKRENLPATMEFAKYDKSGNLRTKEDFVENSLKELKDEQGETFDPKLENVYKDQLEKHWDSTNKRPLFLFKEPIAIKRVEIDSFDKEGKPVLDSNGKQKRKAVLSVYNKQTGGHIVFTREKDAYKGKWVASEYTPKESAQFAQIRDANHLTEEIKPFEHLSEAPMPEINEPAEVKAEEKPISESKEDKKARKEAEKKYIESRVKVIQSKIATYNSLSLKEKRDNIGNDLYNEIQNDVKEIGFNIKLRDKRMISLVNQKGKLVYAQAKKRTESEKEQAKREAEFKRRALNAVPVSVEHMVAMDVANGEKFNKEELQHRTGLADNEIPFGYTSNKEGKINFEDYALRMREHGASMPEDVDEEDIANEAAEIASKYVVKGGRDIALDYVKEQQEKIENGGYTNAEMERFISQGEEAELPYEEMPLTEQEAEEELIKEQYREQAFKETGQFQKKAAIEGHIQNVINKLEKSFDNIKVEYDPTLNAAGKLKGNTITINPYYAGIDTPIHEYGHVFIDAVGYNNKVIQAAIKQLKGTKLWQETANSYPELNDEMLAKEVLAEAIGREGAGIFDKVAEQGKFKQFLNYIFDWLKNKLGINKNIAKSLARQIISGIGTKKMTGASETEQFAKKKFKTIGEMTTDELARKATMSFESYRENVLGEGMAQLQRDIKFLDEALASGMDEFGNPLTEDDLNAIEQTRAAFAKKEKQDLSKYMAYKEDVQMIFSVAGQERLEDLPTEKLVDMYNYINANFGDVAKDPELNRIKIAMALDIRNRQINVVKDKPGFSEGRAATQDLSSYKDIKFKCLSHMPEWVPDLQGLSKLWDTSWFAMIKEAQSHKNTHKKLGDAVIKETNKRLGIVERVKNFVFPSGRKYFDFVEGKNGKVITLDEAKAKGLSNAQMEYVKFVREQMATKEQLMSDGDIYNMDMEVLKIDKSFSEAYQTDGLAQAFSNFLGNSYNIQNVRISYVNPNTGKAEISEYGNIEKEIIAYGNKGLVEKGKAMALLAKYNMKARRQLKTGRNEDQPVGAVKGDPNYLDVIKGGDYSLDSEGKLRNKFNRPRSSERGYSQDFYKAMMEYIDDSAHVKHISPLVPIINSIEYLNKNGVTVATPEGERQLVAKKPNVVKWIEEWRDLHVFKKPKETIPELDLMLKTTRFLTSATTMMFNVPAGIMNAAMGIYNNWRAENASVVGSGMKLLATKPKFVYDVVNKYGAVSADLDSNPMMSAGGIFTKLGHGLTRWGEFMIQSSMFTGQMTKEELDSFEYKQNVHGVNELVVKPGVDEKALEAKMLSYINRVSDIQGKYSDKDKRNIMNNELGKSAMQFRVWMPDFLKERYGAEYIDRDGVVRKGSWSGMVKNGFAELRKDITDKGTVKGLFENKAFMSNLKGSMAVVLLAVLQYQNDDDKKKSGAAKLADRALGDLMFIFDPNTLKFTVSRPIPALATISKFIDAGDHLIAIDADDFNKRTGEAKIVQDVIDLTPGGKKIEQIADFVTE